MGPNPVPPAVRFWRYVKPEDGHWLWTGAVSKAGYARINLRVKPMPAHRFSYEYFVGPVPADMVIDHLCRVRHCVHPAHLEPVSNVENMKRGIAVVGHNMKRKTHCPAGHEYSAANTYVNKRRPGHRYCRVCNTLATRRRRGHGAQAVPL